MHFRRDEHQRELAIWNRALQLVPDSAGLHYQQAAALVRLERYRKALDACNRAIQLGCTYAIAFAERDEVLTHLGEYQQALHALDQAIALAPDYESPYMALLGCCDDHIAAQDATIGMGGPAMIEGGGLGVFAPEEVGPVSMQAPNGVIDVLVADEAEAVRAAKRYLAYFQGPTATWASADQRLLRQILPENRLRVYDMHTVIETLGDQDSLLELRRQFGAGIITALLRIEGRPIGVIANNPLHLGGAIDANAADKAARFMQLCDAFGLPILSLCDTPGTSRACL